jgi:hypothetical protein
MTAVHPRRELAGIIGHTGTRDRYAHCIGVSKPMRCDIDRDIIHAGQFDVPKTFLPDGLSGIERLPFLAAGEKRLVSQIQSRTFANIFGLVERLIAAKVLELSHSPGTRVALEALMRLGAALEQQEMFRRIERMAAAGMAEGYAFSPEADAVASVVLGKSMWAVLALICHIELFVLAHHRESIDLDPNLSARCKDVFLDHWHEESKHAVLAELEWMRENARVTVEQRERAIDELIDLLAAVHVILQRQSQLDADYFLRICWRTFGRDQAERIRAGMLDAYRSRSIVSGVAGRFGDVLGRSITPAQHERIGNALALILS